MAAGMARAGQGVLTTRALSATSGDVTTVVDLDGRYLYCSAASEDMFGWEPDELVGMAEDDFVAP